MKKTIETYPIVAGHESVIDFLYLQDLKNELDKFLKNQEIYTKWLQDEQRWRAFVILMMNILSNQPIHNPTKQVKSFTFMKATDRTVWMRMDFVKPITDGFGKSWAYFEIGNAF